MNTVWAMVDLLGAWAFLALGLIRIREFLEDGSPFDVMIASALIIAAAINVASVLTVAKP